MFSAHSDLLLLRHWERGLSLVMQTKCPGEEVTKSKQIARQMFDHLMTLRRLGHSNPIGVLCSYEELVFCSLPEPVDLSGQHHEADKMDEEMTDLTRESSLVRRRLIQESVDLLRENGGVIREEEQAIDKLISREVERSSDVSNDFEFIPVVLPEYEESKAESGMSETPCQDSGGQESVPAVVYSTPVKREKMFTALVLAVQVGVKAFQEAAPAELPREGAVMKVHLPFVTDGENGNMTWKRCLAPIRFEEPSKGCREFYLVARFGRGLYSRKFMGCDAYGRVVTIKFFLDVVENDDTAAMDEMEYWKSLNGCELVQVLKLNQLVALQTPYFAQIPLERRLDEDVLEGIEGCLRLFAEKGYYFKLRACLVGYRLSAGKQSDEQTCDYAASFRVTRKGGRDGEGRRHCSEAHGPFEEMGED